MNSLSSTISAGPATEQAARAASFRAEPAWLRGLLLVCAVALLAVSFTLLLTISAARCLRRRS